MISNHAPSATRSSLHRGGGSFSTGLRHKPQSFNEACNVGGSTTGTGAWEERDSSVSSRRSAARASGKAPRTSLVHSGSSDTSQSFVTSAGGASSPNDSPWIPRRTNVPHRSEKRPPATARRGRPCEVESGSGLGATRARSASPSNAAGGGEPNGVDHGPRDVGARRRHSDPTPDESVRAERVRTGGEREGKNERRAA